MVARVKLKRRDEPDVASLPDDDARLDIPTYAYADVARRWRISEWTVRDYVRRGWLGPPIYLSAVKPRFTERQLRDFERSRPTNWSETQRGQTQKSRKRDDKGRYKDQ